MAVLAFVSALAACEKPAADEPPIPAADRQEIDSLLAAAEKKADAYSEARAKGLRGALESIDPGLVSGACPSKLPPPPRLVDDPSSLSKEERDAADAAHYRMSVVPSWVVLGKEPPAPLKMMEKIEIDYVTRGPRRDQFNRQDEMLRRLLQAGKYTSNWDRKAMVDLARELGSDEYWGLELDIVAALKVDPTHDASGSFKGGQIIGKAFLWSFKEGRVVCAAPVAASNQDQLTLTVDTKDKSERRNHRLDEDLKNEAYRAAIADLKAVAPSQEAKAPSAAPTSTARP